MIAWLYASAQREILEAKRVDQVSSLSLLLDGEVAGVINIVKALAAMPALKAGDFTTFRPQAEAALSDKIAIFAVMDEKGQQLMSTGVPIGTILPMSRNLAALSEVLQGKTVISDVLTGTVMKQPLIAIAAPVLINGKVAYILTAGVRMEQFNSLFAQAGINPAWAAAVVDRKGVFVARNVHPELYLGQVARPELGAAARGTENRGTFYNTTMEGTYTGNSFWRSTLTGFTSVVSIPNDVLLGPFWKVFAGYSILTLSVLFACLWFASVLARRLSKNIEQIGVAAENLMSTQPLAPFKPYVSELDAVHRAYLHAQGISKERLKAEEKIQNLLHELVHRSKNLITVIQAVANHSGKSASSLEEFLPRYNKRLQSLSATYDLLLEEGGESARLDELIIRHMLPFDAGTNRVTVTGADIILKREVVQSIGMAIHELATNATKYGALSVPSGRVEVTANVEDLENGGTLRLNWKEVGGPRVKPPKRKGFGSVVVERLAAAAVNGQADLRYEASGFKWSLTISSDHFEIGSAGIVK